MRNHFIQRTLKTTPLLFLLIAVFHVGVFIHAAWSFSDINFSITNWQHPLLILAYTIAWITVCSFRKWSAFFYIGFTIVNLLVEFFIAPYFDIVGYRDAMFPADLLFCIVILVYFKKFR